MGTLKLILLIVIAGILFVHPSYVDMLRLREVLQEVNGEVAALEARKRALRERVEGLEDDPVVIEKHLRAIGYGKDGEIIYREIGDE